MTAESKFKQDVSGNDETMTVQLTVPGDVQVTVVLQKAVTPNDGRAYEAVGKAIELLRHAAIPRPSGWEQ